MVQFWETSDISANCEIGVLDEPFYIPLLRTDPLCLRLNIPYHLIGLNGGGLPIGSSVEMKIVNVAGTTTLCDYGNGSTGKFKLGYINDSGNRIASYNILTGIGLADENGEHYDFYSFDVTAGDAVEFDADGTLYSFTYGYDETPYPLIEFVAGKLMIAVPASLSFSYTVSVNGSAQILDIVLPAGTPVCAHENYDCFRVKIFVNMAVSGNDLTFYSKPFKIIRCDEPSVWIEGTYPISVIDCSNQPHNMSGHTFYKNKLSMRILGELDDDVDLIEKSYNSRSFNFKSSIIERFILKGLPIPKWFRKAFQTTMLAQTTRIDGVNLKAVDVTAYTENIEINGVTFQNINLNLQSSKCEKVFVC